MIINKILEKTGEPSDPTHSIPSLNFLSRDLNFVEMYQIIKNAVGALTEDLPTE